MAEDRYGNWLCPACGFGNWQCRDVCLACLQGDPNNFQYRPSDDQTELEPESSQDSDLGPVPMRAPVAADFPAPPSAPRPEYARPDAVPLTLRPTYKDAMELQEFKKQLHNDSL